MLLKTKSILIKETFPPSPYATSSEKERQLRTRVLTFEVVSSLLRCSSAIDQGDRSNPRSNPQYFVIAFIWYFNSAINSVCTTSPSFSHKSKVTDFLEVTINVFLSSDEQPESNKIRKANLCSESTPTMVMS